MDEQQTTQNVESPAAAPAAEGTAEQAGGLLTNATAGGEQNTLGAAGASGQRASSEARGPAELASDGMDTSAERPEDGVPEEYDLKVQEGFTWDKAAADEVAPMFRELGLTNAQAQTLADFYMNKVNGLKADSAAAYRKAQAEEMAVTQADPEVGGRALKENLGYCAQAMDRFGGREFRAELERHGMANNVHMVKFLAKVGREMAGDRLVTGERPHRTESIAKILYPNMNE